MRGLGAAERAVGEVLCWQISLRVCMSARASGQGSQPETRKWDDAGGHRAPERGENAGVEVSSS